MSDSGHLGDKRQLFVDVVSKSKPEQGPERDTYRADAEIWVSEGTSQMSTKAHLVIQHPSGWMGVNAGFSYFLDAAEYPTFAARAEQAILWAMDEFPSEDGQILSVFLLGSGQTEYQE